MRYLNIFNLILFVLITTLISCNTSTENNFKVEVKLDNLSVKEIYAVKNFSEDSLVIDTLKPKTDGSFSFTGKVEVPILVTLFYAEKFPPLRFFIDKDYTVQIKGDAQDPLSIEIKGGAINDDLNTFKKDNKSILLSRFRIFDKDSPVDPAHLKNIDFQLSRLVRDYVAKNPAKLSSVVLMDEYSRGTLAPELLNQDIELLQGEAAQYYLTTSLKEYNDKALASMVGVQAPQIELKNTKGDLVKLSDYIGKNVLLIFDLKDAPGNHLYFNKLKDARKELKKQVEFVAVVIDEDTDHPDPNTVKVASNLDWVVLLDSNKWNSKEAIKYNITTLPYMILVSSEGKILERDVSIDSLVANIDRYNFTPKE